MAILVGLYQNNNQFSKAYSKWYTRPSYGKIIDLKGLSEHIHQHHSIYPQEVVKGVLECASRCTRELMLEGYPVKFDGLGIFKASVENEGGFDRPANANLIIGGKDATGKPVGVKAVKMICQATGEFTRKELSESSVLQWSDLAQSIIDADKTALKNEQAAAAAGGNGDNTDNTGGE